MPMKMTYHTQHCLSREDRYILEKHSQDLFRLLLKRILAAETADQFTQEDERQCKGMLAEYFKTRAMLVAE
ncbi:MAG: hypothetical protein FD123_5 [Bacteroidetes bacterium]|nr:MAG: hypothetical protein FD123_5 [Bacteroidota bacterium]